MQISAKHSLLRLKWPEIQDKPFGGRASPGSLAGLQGVGQRKGRELGKGDNKEGTKGWKGGKR